MHKLPKQCGLYTFKDRAPTLTKAVNVRMTKPDGTHDLGVYVPNTHPMYEEIVLRLLTLEGNQVKWEENMPAIAGEQDADTLKLLEEIG
jgi:hypothetical protein